MKKTILILLIFFLIITTTITKNSTKKLENQIFSVKENISILQNEYELILLEYNFLTTPKKLLEYQHKYFDDDLIPLVLNDIKEIKIKDKKLIIRNFN